MEGTPSPVKPSQDDRVTLDISPIMRAQDAFALAKYLCRRTHSPHFYMTSVANERVIFVTTRDGWRCLRESLEAQQDDMLRIASIDGNSVNLRMSPAVSLRTLEGSGSQSLVEDD